VFGEGPTEIEAGMFTDTKRAEFTGQDIRFTTQGDRLFAVALAWPGESLRVTSLALDAPEAGRVTAVRRLGRDDLLAFEQRADALHVSLPTEAPGDAAFAFEIVRA
jgi:alpha-L-fucosidase